MTPFDLGESPTRHDRSTADLVRLARQGDHDAFATLVVRHERMVLRTALRLLGRLDRAQDAAQETFLRLFRYLGRYDETLEMGPWLYRVVVNVCRDLGRKSGPRLVPLEDAPDGASPGSPGSPEAVEGTLARAEERRLVRAALVALPEKERAALVLRDLEGRPTSEVARILGSSEGTVRSQVSTARLKIRAFLRGPLGGRAGGAIDRPSGGSHFAFPAGARATASDEDGGRSPGTTGSRAPDPGRGARNQALRGGRDERRNEEEDDDEDV